MAKAYEYVVEIRAGFNKLSNDMRQASGQFKKLEKDVTGVFKNISAIAKSAAVLGGVVAINQLKNAVMELAKKGEAAGSIAEGFQKLGGSSKSIQDASKATLGLVSKFELMKLANQALLKGIPQVNENFAMLADYAGRVANTLDQDTGTALENLINGLSTVKEKQLAAIGITIDADEAYRKYAESNNIAAVAGKRWEDVLTSQEQKLAKQNAAVEAVRNNLDKLAPVSDSVANAQQAYNQAIDDGLATMGNAINNNTQLADAYRQLEKVINEIDWEKLGEDIGTVSGIMATMASSVLPLLASEFSKVARGFESLFGETAQSSLDKLTVKILELESSLAEVRNSSKPGAIIGRMVGLDDKLSGQLASAKKDFKDLLDAQESLRLSEEKLAAMREAKGAKLLKDMKDKAEADKEAEAAGRRIAEAMAAAAEETKKFREALDKEETKQLEDGVKKGLDVALKSLNKSSFEYYTKLLEEVTRDGITKGWGKSYENSQGEDRQKADDIANAGAKAAGDEYRNKFAEAAKDFKKEQIKAGEEAAKKTRERYEEVAQGVESAFRNAFSSVGGSDWRTNIMDLGVTLAATLTAAFQTGVTDNPKVVQGIADLGVVLGNYLAKTFGATAFGDNNTPGEGASIGKIASAAGQAYFNDKGERIDPSLFGIGDEQKAMDAGAIGQNQDGSFIYPESGVKQDDAAKAEQAAKNAAAWASAAGTILGAATSSAYNKKTGEKEGAVAGGIIGAAIGAYFGGPQGAAAGAQIGSALGSFFGGLFKKGVKNPETKARHAFEQWLEDRFKELGKIRIMDANGKLGGYLTDFRGKELTPDFNDQGPGGWVSDMDAWGEKAKNSFLGLGEAMKELRGISEDVGAQIGYMLGTNLAGNIDNAKLLMLQLGLTFEEVSEALLKSAMKGTISWLAFNSYIRDTAEAFKPGLSAVGAISQAFQNLIDGAGQGRESVKAFKDIAVEAMEAGVKTMEGLKQYLLAQGFDPEYVEALMDAAKQRGVDSLKEWSEATDQVAGSIIGDMEAMSTKLQEEWNKMRENLKDFSKSLKEIPKEVQSTIKIKVKTEYDENTKQVIERMGNVLPSGVPNEGERDMSETATAQTGRLARATSAARSTRMVSRMTGKVYTPATGNPFGGGVIRTPVITGKPYDVAAGGMNLVQRPPEPSRTPGVNINIDAKGAAAGAENAIMDASRQIEANVINTILPMIRDAGMRGGRGADY